jgi:hypothetical protein
LQEVTDKEAEEVKAKLEFEEKRKNHYKNEYQMAKLLK